MPSPLRSPVLVLASAFAIALLAARPVDAAVAPGPLAGKTLTSTRELQSGLESLAGSLLSGDLRGEITRVVVTEDAPRRLVITVGWQGFAGGKLWGEVLESARSRQAGIRLPEPVELSGASGELEMVFEAEDAGALRRSPYLRINAALAGRSTPGFRRTFELGKEWSAALPAGGDFLTTITPRPVGRTAELGPQPSYVVPTGTIVAPPSPPGSTPPVAPPTAAPTSTAPSATSRRILASASPLARPTGTRLIAPEPARPATPAPSTNAALRALPASTAIHAISAAQFGLHTQDIDRGARGPATMAILPFGAVRTENIRLDLPRVFDFSPEVYPDLNPASGIFYFVPSGFGLDWTSTEGYQLRTVYASADAAGSAGQVLMAARLDAGIDGPEVQLASELVRAYAQSHQLPFSELRALPIDSVQVSLADALGPFSVRGDRVAVHGLSDVMGQMDVSWTTDERTMLFIQEALVENVGLSGDATFHAVGGGLRARRVPVRIRLADEAAFGTLAWDRTGWKNPTPYPITLRYLHALRVAPGQPPVVHTWALGDVRVPPGGQVRWNATAVPFWLDRDARKMWLDYAVDGSCTECGSQAIAGLTGGVSTTGASEITFHTLTPLADAGAVEALVEVRSRWWDPRGAATQVKTVVLDADGKDFRLGPLFVGNRADEGSSEPLFEYRLALTMKDGRPERGEGRWISSRDLRVLVGPFQVQSSLGALPAR